VEARFGIRRIDRAPLSQWQAEADRRTTHVLDVRTPEEFTAGHLPGSVSAPGGQLVQAIDRWVGTRGARLVLVDDDGTRAIMTAHWLKQLGWDVQVLDRALDGAVLETASAVPSVSSSRSVPAIEPAKAARLLAEGAAGICLEPSAAYRQAHPQGAAWSIRPRLGRLPAATLKATGIVMFSADEAAARLAAVDLAELGGGRIMLASGGTQAWSTPGFPLQRRRAILPTRSASTTCFGTTIATPAIATRCRPICAGKPNCPTRSSLKASPALISALIKFACEGLKSSSASPPGARTGAASAGA
jgi:rhodanese-related sulfurtransferase